MGIAFLSAAAFTKFQVKNNGVGISPAVPEWRRGNRRVAVQLGIRRLE
ncbi:MAG: hypothetical protein ABIL68_17605 [bacterium]